MTDAEIRAAVFRALGRVAPEIDASVIRPDVSFRDQVDIDSMDFLNFLIELHRDLGVDIPESDYPQLGTLDRLVAYLAPRIPAQPVPSRRGG